MRFSIELTFLSQKLMIIFFYLSSTQYSVVDYFQMAIAEVGKVLAGFKPEKSSSLKAYGMMAFSSLLKASLRQRHDADICTNPSLLRKVGRRRMVEALQDAGLSSEVIARYQLACGATSTRLCDPCRIEI